MCLGPIASSQIEPTGNAYVPAQVAQCLDTATDLEYVDPSGYELSQVCIQLQYLLRSLPQL